VKYQDIQLDAKQQYFAGLRFLEQREFGLALKFFLESSKSKFPLAYLQCGKMLEKGKGCALDLQGAKVFYQLGIDVGVINCYYRLGRMSKSLNLIKKGATLNDADCIYELAKYEDKKVNMERSAQLGHSKSLISLYFEDFVNFDFKFSILKMGSGRFEFYMVLKKIRRLLKRRKIVPKVEHEDITSSEEEGEQEEETEENSNIISKNNMSVNLSSWISIPMNLQQLYESIFKKYQIRYKVLDRFLTHFWYIISDSDWKYIKSLFAENPAPILEKYIRGYEIQRFTALACIDLLYESKRSAVSEDLIEFAKHRFQESKPSESQMFMFRIVTNLDNLKQLESIVMDWDRLESTHSLLPSKECQIYMGIAKRCLALKYTEWDLGLLNQSSHLHDLEAKFHVRSH
jgi:hypothetical protein